MQDPGQACFAVTTCNAPVCNHWLVITSELLSHAAFAASTLCSNITHVFNETSVQLQWGLSVIQTGLQQL